MATRGSDGSVKISIDWDDSNLSRDIKKTKQLIDKELDDVEVKADLVADDNSIDELKKDLDKLDDVEINAEVNVDDSSIKNVNKQLDDLDTTLTPKVDVDDSGLDQAQKKIDDLKGEKVTVPVTADTSGLDIDNVLAVGGTVAGLTAITVASEEVVESQGLVKTSMEEAGFSAEQATSQYKEFYKLIGESDTAAEATQLLSQLAKDQEQLTNWTTIATGVQAKFGDSLKTETLIEYADETIKTGALVGDLERVFLEAGYSVDVVNKVLEDLGSETERNAFVTQTLTEAYTESAEAYRENSAELLNYRDAQFELNNALAQMGTSLMPIFSELMPIIVQIFDELFPPITQLIQMLLPALEETLNAVMPIINELIAVLLPIFNEVLQTALPILQEVAQTILPIVLQVIQQLAPILSELVTMILPLLVQNNTALLQPLAQLAQTLLPTVIRLLNSLTPILQLVINLIGFISEKINDTLVVAIERVGLIVDYIIGVFSGLIDFWTGVFTGDWEKAWNGILNIVSYGKTFILGMVESLVNGVIKTINGMISAINLIPLVSFDLIDEVSFATDIALEEEKLRAEREAGLKEEEKMLDDHNQLVLKNQKENDEKIIAEMEAKAEQEKLIAEGSIKTNEDVYDEVFDVALENAENIIDLENSKTSDLEDLYAEQEQAYKDSINNQIDLLEDIQYEQLDLLEDVSDEKIDIISDEYIETMRLQDEATAEFLDNKNEEIEAELEKLGIVNQELASEIQAQRDKLANIEAVEEAEKKAFEEQQEREKIADMQAEIRAEEDAERRAKLEEDLQDYYAELEREREQEKIEAQKEAIEEEIKLLEQKQQEEIALAKETIAEQQKAQAEAIEGQVILLEADLAIGTEDVDVAGEAMVQSAQLKTDYAKEDLNGLNDYVATEFSNAWNDNWLNIVNITKNALNMIMEDSFTMLNSVIGAFNQLGSSLSGVEGQSWGFTIPTLPEVPYLAKGGIVPTATLAMVGEAGKEAVLPLENNTGWMDDLAKKVAEISGGGIVFSPTYNSPKALSAKDIYNNDKKLVQRLGAMI